MIEDLTPYVADVAAARAELRAANTAHNDALGRKLTAQERLNDAEERLRRAVDRAVAATEVTP